MREIGEVLDEREKTHGRFADHADLSQSFKGLARDGADCMPPPHREALDMIFHKIARVLNGDHDHADHWVDIAGYATLVVRELER